MSKSKKDMYKLHETIMNRRKHKANELNKAKSSFDISYEMERHMGCFETNAINSLMYIKTLKAELSELDEIEKLVRCILNQYEGE